MSFAIFTPDSVDMDRRINLAAVVCGLLLIVLNKTVGLDYWLTASLAPFVLVGVALFQRTKQAIPIKAFLGSFVFLAASLFMIQPAHAFDGLGISFYRAVTYECFTCQLLDQMLLWLSATELTLFNELSDTFGNLIAIILVLWILFQGARILLPFTNVPVTRSVIGDIVRRLGVGFIAITILAAPYNTNILIQGLVSPLRDSGLLITQFTLEQASDIVGSTIPGGVDIIKDNCRLSSNPDFPGSSNLPNSYSAANDRYFDDAAIQARYNDQANNVLIVDSGTEGEAAAEAWSEFYCYIFAAQRMYGSVIALSFGVGAHSLQTIHNSVNRSDDYLSLFGSDPSPSIVGNSGPNFMQASQGENANAFISVILVLVVIALFFWVFFKFLVLFVEFVFRFALIVAISPLLLASFVFPMFRGASTAGLGGLLYSGVKLWLQSIVVVVGIFVIYQMTQLAFPAGDMRLPTNLYDSNAFEPPAHIYEILQNLGANLSDSGATRTISFYEVSRAFLVFMTGGLMILFLMRLAEKLVDEMIRAAITVSAKVGSDISASASGVVSTAAAAVANRTGIGGGADKTSSSTGVEKASTTSAYTSSDRGSASATATAKADVVGGLTPGGAAATPASAMNQSQAKGGQSADQAVNLTKAGGGTSGAIQSGGGQAGQAVGGLAQSTSGKGGRATSAAQADTVSGLTQSAASGRQSARAGSAGAGQGGAAGAAASSSQASGSADKASLQTGQTGGTAKAGSRAGQAGQVGQTAQTGQAGQTKESRADGVDLKSSSAVTAASAGRGAAGKQGDDSGSVDLRSGQSSGQGLGQGSGAAAAGTSEASPPAAIQSSTQMQGAGTAGASSSSSASQAGGEVNLRAGDTTVNQSQTTKQGDTNVTNQTATQVGQSSGPQKVTVDLKGDGSSQQTVVREAKSAGQQSSSQQTIVQQGQSGAGKSGAAAKENKTLAGKLGNLLGDKDLEKDGQQVEQEGAGMGGIQGSTKATNDEEKISYEAEFELSDLTYGKTNYDDEES